MDLTPIYGSCDTLSLTVAKAEAPLLNHFSFIVTNISHLGVFWIEQHVIGSNFAHDNLLKKQLWHLEMHPVEKVNLKAEKALESVFGVNCLSNCD